MKKLALFILTISIVFVTSCGNTSSDIHETTDSIHTGSQTEQVYEKFDSIEELRTYFDSAVSGSSVYSENSDNDILYYPEILIDGYELLFAVMNSHYIFYYYMPSEYIENDSERVFDRDMGFVVSVSIDEVDGDRIEILSNQLKISISDDGTIYDEKNDVLIVPIGNTVLTLLSLKVMRAKEPSTRSLQ